MDSHPTLNSVVSSSHSPAVAYRKKGARHTGSQISGYIWGRFKESDGFLCSLYNGNRQCWREQRAWYTRRTSRTSGCFLRVSLARDLTNSSKREENTYK